jgi:hypothetical protein
MTEAEFKAALDRIERQMARDYLAEAAKINRNTTLAEMMRAIELGNAVQSGVLVGNYAKLAESLRAAYIAGGTAEAADFGRRGVEFDALRPSAQSWIQETQRGAVSIIAREQGEAIQAVISYGQEIGMAPAPLARNLLGMTTQSGARMGGVVGLTGQDAQWLTNAARQLRSGDPEQMRQYFDRVRRDRRFDGIVQRAIDAGKPVAPADIDKITQRYAARLLETRAEVVASIQAVEAYNAGRAQFYAQLVEDGTDPALIRKRWKTQADERVRVSHRAMNGQKVPGSAAFVTPRGALMMHPGDTSMGAPLSEIVRCRCRAIYTIEGE